jgi:hypothetical protein
LMEREERVLLETPVVARLSIGSEHLRLFFTDWRIIVAHVGKRGVGSLGMVSFFGWLSSVVEDLFKGGRESLGRRRLKRSGPDEILAADRDNFFISYADVVSLNFDRTFLRPGMTVLTRDDKYRFAIMGRSEPLLDFLHKVLEGKLSVN